MAAKTLLGLPLLVACSVFSPAFGQNKYIESSVVNAECASAPLPAPVTYPGPYTVYAKGADTTGLIFNVNWSDDGKAETPPIASLACDLKIPVYSVAQVNRMLDDLRGEVLNAVKAGVVQAAIREDQLQSISDTVQRSVEREIRAGLIREIAELRQQLNALEQRLATQEARQ